MSDNIVNSIKIRVKLLKEIHNTAVKYYKHAGKYITGMDPAFSVEVASAIENLQLCIDGIEHIQITTVSVINDELLLSVYKLYEMFNNVDLNIRTIMRLFNSELYARMILTEMSSASHADLRMDVMRSKNNRDKYESHGSEDEFYFAEINTVIRSDPVYIDTAYTFVVNAKLINKFVIDLLKSLMQITSSGRKKILKQLVREMMIKTLNYARIPLNDEIGIAGRILSYGLKPVTSSMPMREMFKHIGMTYHTDDLQSIANDNKICIVIMNCASKSPVEFNFSGVIDSAYVNSNDLKVKFMSGINKKILTRYTTASMLPTHHPVAPSTMRVFMCSSNTTKSIIIETINGTDYRILSTDESPFCQIPKGLIEGITTLPTVYSLLHMKNIFNSRAGDMFDPNSKMVLNRYADDQKIIPSSEPIKNLVCEDILGYFKSHVHSISKYGDVIDVVLSKRFREIVLSTVFARARGNNPFIGKPKSSEYLITYISKLDNLISKFMKSIIREASDESLSDRFFKELPINELETMIISTFTNILHKAADKLDSENLWTGYGVSLKEYLLNN